MEEILKKKLKKISLVSAVFLSFTLILFAILLLDFFKVRTLKTVTLLALSSADIAEEYKSISNLKEVRSPNNLVFPAIFEGTLGDNKEVILSFVRLTGKYGVYQGLFLYDKSKKEAFLCAVIADDYKKHPSNYGINEGIIQYWKKKIVFEFDTL